MVVIDNQTGVALRAYSARRESISGKLPARTLKAQSSNAYIVAGDFKQTGLVGTRTAVEHDQWSLKNAPAVASYGHAGGDLKQTRTIRAGKLCQVLYRRR